MIIIQPISITIPNNCAIIQSPSFVFAISTPVVAYTHTLYFYPDNVFAMALRALASGGGSHFRCFKVSHVVTSIVCWFSLSHISLMQEHTANATEEYSIRIRQVQTLIGTSYVHLLSAVFS